MAVRGYAEYLGKSSVGAAERQECLERIVEETRKIENIVRGLLSVSSAGSGDGAECDVNGAVRESVEILSFRKMFEDIEVRTEYGEVGRARIDAGRLQQVLLNLFLNAVDAMDNRGTLSVRTFEISRWSPRTARDARRRAGDSADAEVAMLRAGRDADQDGVAVSVSDTGAGIGAEDLDSVFDPFFTTKEPGKGTGLGLSVSRAIVEGAGGEIRVESEKGKGATFTVVLPLLRAADAAAGAAEERSDG